MVVTLTRLVNRFLRQRGIYIRFGRFRQPRKSDVSPAERRELAAVIEKFVAENPRDSGPACRDSLKEYLHYTRLAFYHNVMELCRDAGVDFANRDVADVGTGPGYLCRLIKQAAPTSRVWGYDLSADRLTFARTLCEDVEFCVCDLMDVDRSFDVVFLMEVLEHLIEPEKVLQKLLSLVRSHGWAVITVPNGREDHYAGHVNFWSPESWQHFIELNVGADFQPTFGLTRNGNNFVALRRVAGTSFDQNGEAHVAAGTGPVAASASGIGA